jgi:hypothetical protein
VPSDMFITTSARRLPSSLFHEVGGAAPLVSNLLSLVLRRIVRLVSSTKVLIGSKGKCGIRLSNWKHPRDALWAFCEETNTCGRDFSAERLLKISVTSPSSQYTEFCYL